MKDATKKTVKPEKQLPAPTLANLFHFPMTAVMRRLGKEGVSTAHARAIFAALKVKASDTTVSIQVNAGRSKGYADRGEPAALTAAQVKELVNAAPDPAKAEKAEAKK